MLLRRYNTGYQDGNYSVVAGHLNGGEQIRAAAVREAREEVGIGVALGDLEIVGVMHRLSDDERIDFFLTTSSWSGEITNAEPDRCDRLTWFDMRALPDNVIPYVRRALENFLRSRRDAEPVPGGAGRRRREMWFDSFGWGE